MAMSILMVIAIHAVCVTTDFALKWIYGYRSSKTMKIMILKKHMPRVHLFDSFRLVSVCSRAGSGYLATFVISLLSVQIVSWE